MRCLVLLFAPLLCLAQQCQPNSPSKRYALVIGNQAYTKLSAVPTAAYEAQVVKTALEGAGFKVTSIQNATMPALLTRDEAAFLKQVQPGDVVFVYYSGHIVQGSDQDDYLVPVNFDPATELNSSTAASLTRILQDMVDRKAGLKIVMLEGPRALETRLRGAGDVGLLSPDLRDSGETLFAMSAQLGQVVTPPAPPATALFTKAVVERLGQPGLAPDQVFEQARREVGRLTNQRQLPFVNSSVVSDSFCFHAPITKVDPSLSKTDKGPTVIVQNVVQTVPTNRVDRQEYVFIPPAKFKMGCVPADTHCDANEKPQHDVTLTKGFWMGRNEVTVSAYRRFVDASDKKMKMPGAPNFNSGWRSGDQPIVLVKWDEARAYCSWAGGRLPTEAEWEYAARGGKSNEVYPLNSENSRDKANFYGKQGNDSYETAAPVHSFDANPLNLFDMAGNVWEWVEDWYSPTYYAQSPATDPAGPMTGKEHVIRGGSFDSDWKEHLRLSFRKSQGGGMYSVGFRCVLDDTEQIKKQLNLN